MMPRWLTLGLAIASASPAAGQTYEIAWHTVDGGGGTGSTAGPFVLDGTSGQPDAGGPHAGGAYTVRGGFWAVAGGAPGAQCDLAVTKLDDPDPVLAGATLVYTIQVTNLGPSPSSGMTVLDTLPAGVTFVSATPGAPTCSHASGSVSCTLGPLAPSVAHTVTITVGVGAAVSGTLSNSASVTGFDVDPVPANDVDTEPTAVIAASGAERELSHGSRLLTALGPGASDSYRIRQQAFASYEVVVDATSGDIGVAQGPALERTAANGTTVIQASVAVGAGPSRSLRWMNTTGAMQDGEHVRVRSVSCTSGCGGDDVYRVRAWETTGRIARFNNSASQATVVLIQNTAAAPVSGRIAFWSVPGTFIHEQPFDLGPRAVLSLNTASIAPLVGQGGSITVMHDGPHGTLSGKAVSVEPSTGFSFDSLLEWRPR